MKQIKTILVLISLLVSARAFALDPVSTSLFSDKAIKGYDTVAYFTENQPVKGKSEFSVEHQGATWLFSSQENLDLFKADPEKYAPQFGGYCAYAVAQNSTAPIKPELFTIVDGKLYLNYNRSINDKWLANQDKFIKDAEANWPSLLSE